MSWSCTIFTTNWPGVTDLMTSTPTALAFTLSVKARTTSSATSASSSARRTSRSAASTSASLSAPRRVSRSRMPPSRSDSESNRFLLRTVALRATCGQTPMAPEGASRCRAGASGLSGPVGGSKSRLLRERAEPMGEARAESRNTAKNGAFLRRLACLSGCQPSDTLCVRAVSEPAGETAMESRQFARIALAGLILAAVPPAAAQDRVQGLSQSPGHHGRALSPPVAGSTCSRASLRSGSPSGWASLRGREPPGRRNRHRRQLRRQGRARRLHHHARHEFALRHQCHAEQAAAVRSGQGFCADHSHLRRAVPAAGASGRAGEDRSASGSNTSRRSRSRRLTGRPGPGSPQHLSMELLKKPDRDQAHPCSLSWRCARTERSGRRAHSDPVRAADTGAAALARRQGARARDFLGQAVWPDGDIPTIAEVGCARIRFCVLADDRRAGRHAEAHRRSAAHRAEGDPGAAGDQEGVCRHRPHRGRQPAAGGRCASSCATRSCDWARWSRRPGSPGRSSGVTWHQHSHIFASLRVALAGVLRFVASRPRRTIRRKRCESSCRSRPVGWPTSWRARWRSRWRRHPARASWSRTGRRGRGDRRRSGCALAGRRLHAVPRQPGRERDVAASREDQFRSRPRISRGHPPRNLPEPAGGEPGAAGEDGRELVDHAKANPEEAQLRVPGQRQLRPHGRRAVQAVAGIDMVHVPYRGAAPAVQDLVAGHVQVMFDSVTLQMPQITAGKTRALAVMAPQRVEVAPRRGDHGRGGLAEMAGGTWFGLSRPPARRAGHRLGQRRGPQGVRVAGGARALLSQGATLPLGTPEEFAAHVAAERTKWGEVIRRAGIKME